MENKIKALLIVFFMLMTSISIAQYDPPSGYTTYYSLGLWNQGAKPGATALNNNNILIDATLNSIANSVTTVANSVTAVENSITALPATIKASNNTWAGSNTFNAVSTKALSSTVTTLTGTTSVDIDWSLSNTFVKTLSGTPGAATTITFSNTTSGQIITIALTNTASNYTVVWPAISWVGNVAPTQTIGAKTDIYTIIKINSTFYGSYVQNF